MRGAGARFRLLAILAAAFGIDALAGPADIEGRIAYSIDRDRVAVQIERIANNTTTRTSSLYVSIWLTAGSTPLGSGHLAARHRITGNGDGALGPGQYFSDIRWDLAYQRPARGTYYVHVLTSQHPEPNALLHWRTFPNRLTVGQRDDDHGDSTSTATDVAVPGAAAGRIDPVSDQDYFRFRLSSPGTIVAWSSGLLDTYGALYDANGRRLAENDDSANSLNFRIERPSAAGTYYVSVASFGRSLVGAYTLHLSLKGSGSPDLVVESLSGSEATVAPGGAFVLSAMVRNRGEAESPASTARAYRETGGRTLLAQQAIPALAPSATAAIELRIQAAPVAGTSAYTVCVAAVAGESNTSNNCAAVATVRVAEPAGEPQSFVDQPTLGDFNGDGRADVLLRHAGTGRWHYYPMNGRWVYTGAGEAALTPNLAWAVAGIGDFNGDGCDDVLLRRSDTGRWYFYPLNGRRVLAGRGEAPLTTDFAWAVAGIGDLDGDGRDDVLMRHGDTGRWRYYPMDGRTASRGAGLANLPPDLAWAAAGVGDFDGDGRDDVLLRHGDTGRWRYYPMNGRRALAGRGSVPLASNLAWAVAGIGDMNRDGRDDVLLRHGDTGRWHYYPMHGRRVLAGRGGAPLTTDLAWAVAGIGDMNGDGRSDVLVRGDSGAWHYYPMSGRRSLSGAGRVNLPAEAAWQVAAPPAGVSAADGLRISTATRSPVQPFQVVSVAVAGGTATADYDILLDLSGSGVFPPDDTIAVAPVKASAGRLQMAAPLPEALSEGNAGRRFAIRLRERGAEALSNPLTFTLRRIDVPASLAGHPTAMLDVVLKAAYESLDDPLLTVEAGAIAPGRSLRAARALGLGTAFSDAQAEALLQSMLGAALVAPGSGQADLPGASVRCGAFPPDALCDAYLRLVNCVGDAIAGFGSGSVTADSLDHCARRGAEVVVEAWDDYGEKIRAAGNFLRHAAPRLARTLGVGKPAQQLHDLNATVRQVIGANKTVRAVAERAEGLRETYEAMRDATQALTEGNAELVTEAEQEIAADGVDDAERDAYFALVEEADHHQSDAAAIEALEDVYTGEADVVETLGRAAAETICGSDYEEFPVDHQTSTCVWNSLVEWNCYAGSRQASHPDLGGANACLYDSLGFFQPNGTCRENYAKVTFLGRKTCRWAELGADKAAWYTLEKEQGVRSPQTPPGSAPGEGFRDCATCPLMVAVPAGSFSMGGPESEAPYSSSDERPQRTVSVHALAASAFEVTFAEWDRCVAEGGCGGYSPDDEGWGRGDRPVVNVSWHDAQRYVGWLSRKTGQTYRLPTEAEWEYAARADTTTPFHTGGTISPQQANFYGGCQYASGDCPGGLYREQTVPTGSFAPNAFGLYDVHGNVWEWVQDCYGSYQNAPADGSASEDGNCAYRIVRGGSWFSKPWVLRSANRNGGSPGERHDDLGFRVVRMLVP